MQLCIDVGNTKTKIGIFDKFELIKTWSKKNFTASDWLNCQKEYIIDAAIVSNTRDDSEALKSILSSLECVFWLNANTQLPIENLYATPETLGRDRTAVVCAASSLIPNQNVLVLDTGTCITLDMISKSGKYFGGSIHPGISMRLKALNNYTGKLPLVKRQNAIHLLGDSTETSILAGVQYAIIKEMDGMIEDYKVKYGELKVIITGGDAPFFVSKLKSKIFAHSNLVLKGLNKILMYNVEEL